MRSDREQTYSRTSPKSSGRGCLCKDGTYSKSCCKGKMINQGIGALSGQGASEISQIHKSFNNDFDKSFAI